MFFEIDDIKRRHSPYTDNYNVHGWIDLPDDAAWWKFFRASVAGICGTLIYGVQTTALAGYKQLRTKYDPPKDLKQKIAYMKYIPKTQAYKTVGLLQNTLFIIFLFFYTGYTKSY